jgi:phosphoglucosamine mutase
LSDQVEARIEALMDSEVAPMLARSPNLGRAKRIAHAQARYIEYAKRTLSREVSLAGLRVVIDCANGAAYEVAPEALWELGAEVNKIGVEPNGLNNNFNVGSTAPEALSRKVRQVGANVGIALDGDADRMIIVDENGHVVDDDQVMALIAESWLHDGQLSKPRIVVTLMSNLGLERQLASLGLALERTAVGDRYAIERMRDKGFNPGGEQSGHVILSDYSTTGDGLVSALNVLAIVQKLGKPVSEVYRRFEPLPQVLRNLHFHGSKPLENPGVARAIAEATARLGDRGRLVVRASGTDARHPGNGRGLRQGAGRQLGHRPVRRSRSSRQRRVRPSRTRRLVFHRSIPVNAGGHGQCAALWVF